ncbi:hypothetical protein [Alicyclobacillus mengziensis]|uniref:Uncharacterized protein n=1 Tax=Alicyclobacillus mengziensis TaxID=2931921 RepID=A0A9X7Z6V8_9BACL|nr:hypothetical protein [Alicyclobacillus mengziensis]QSO46638.1 hypothetical protein JZ786_19635 [Alicyclobacillus mengziensis]
MTMPQIPEEKFRPSLDEVVVDLMESIALEEIALSHLMNAEAEKIQMFVGKHDERHDKPRIHEMIELNKMVNQLLEIVVMKEWMLLRKLQMVVEIERESYECEE